MKKRLDILQFILNSLFPIGVSQRQMDDFIRFYELGGYDEPEFSLLRQWGSFGRMRGWSSAMVHLPALRVIT